MEENNQFPSLSFQDSLNFLSAVEQAGNAQHNSFLEARNSAPLLQDYYVSPRRPSGGGEAPIRDTSPFRCGAIDLLNTPSPKKLKRDAYLAENVIPELETSEIYHDNNSRHNKSEETPENNMEQEDETSESDLPNILLETEEKRGKKRKFSHQSRFGFSLSEDLHITPQEKSASGKQQGNARMVMRFRDIRNGLGQATLSSNRSASEILQARPMYKNISKTLFTEPEMHKENASYLTNDSLTGKDPVSFTCDAMPVDSNTPVTPLSSDTSSLYDAKFTPRKSPCWASSSPQVTTQTVSEIKLGQNMVNTLNAEHNQLAYSKSSLNPPVSRQTVSEMHLDHMTSATNAERNHLAYDKSSLTVSCALSPPCKQTLVNVSQPSMFAQPTVQQKMLDITNFGTLGMPFEQQRLQLQQRQHVQFQRRQQQHEQQYHVPFTFNDQVHRPEGNSDITAWYNVYSTAGISNQSSAMTSTAQNVASIGSAMYSPTSMCSEPTSESSINPEDHQSVITKYQSGAIPSTGYQGISDANLTSGAGQPMHSANLTSELDQLMHSANLGSGFGQSITSRFGHSIQNTNLASGLGNVVQNTNLTSGLSHAIQNANPPSGLSQVVRNANQTSGLSQVVQNADQTSELGQSILTSRVGQPLQDPEFYSSSVMGFGQNYPFQYLHAPGSVPTVTATDSLQSLSNQYSATAVQNRRRGGNCFVPVQTVPDPHQILVPNRKRRLIFDHIPNQQSSVKERIKYWEREGSLRTTGDPGLPGARAVKILKGEGQRPVLYCETPPTEDEGSETEELYGAPKLMRRTQTEPEHHRLENQISEQNGCSQRQNGSIGGYSQSQNNSMDVYNQRDQFHVSPDVIEILGDEDNADEVGVKALNRLKGLTSNELAENAVSHMCSNTQLQKSSPSMIQSDTGNHDMNNNEAMCQPGNSSGIRSSSVSGETSILSNQNLTHPEQCTTQQNLCGLPTPPTTPLMGAQQPLVQVLQFNPRLLHIQSLNVGGMTALAPSPVQNVQPASALSAQKLVAPQATSQIPHSYNTRQTVAIEETRTKATASSSAGNVPFSHYNVDLNQAPVVMPMPRSKLVSSFPREQRPDGIIAQPLPALAPSPLTSVEPVVIPKAESRTTQRPRYFDVTRLQIGLFSVSNTDQAVKKKIVLKLMFGKRKMVYEYELAKADEDKADTRQPIVSIEIPFSTIVGLKGFENTLTVEVGTSPVLHYDMKKNDGHVANATLCYEKHRLSDRASEQIMSEPYHQLQLKMPVAEKIKALLSSCDSRFEAMQTHPLVLMPTKLLSCSVNQQTNPAVLSNSVNPKTNKPAVPVSDPGPIHELQNCVDKCSTSSSQTSAHQSLQDVVSTNVSTVVATPRKGRARAKPVGCMCNKGCRTARCRCVIGLQECGPWCTCHKQGNCFNMLNQLVDVEIDVTKAKKDACLIANLTRVPNLKKFVAQEVYLECCNKVVQLRECIPGRFTCPGVGCHKMYFFSWCSGILCEVGNSWRKHCEECRRCTAITNEHCSNCAHCHERLAENEKCPYSSRSAPQKVPVASFSNSVVSANGKPADFIPVSRGPLRSESYGKYIIGPDAVGQKIKRLEDIDVIKSPKPVSTHSEGKATNRCHQSVTQQPNCRGDDSGLFYTQVSPSHTRETFSTTERVSSCVSENLQTLIEGSVALNQSSNIIHPENENTNDLCFAAGTKDSFCGLHNISSISQDDNETPEQVEVREDATPKKRDSSRSKPKVSLLAQLLESESDTDTKILPQLLDSDDNPKNNNDKEKKVKKQKKGSKVQSADKSSTEEQITQDGEKAQCGESAPDQPIENPTNIMDGILNNSDTDQILNLIDIPNLADIDMDMFSDPFGLECQKAIDTIQMTDDDNFHYFASDDLQLPPPQQETNFDCGLLPSQELQTPEIDMHPRSDGTVDDFPDILSQSSSSSSMASPALTNSLGKILGRPLNTSSPIPK